MPSKMTRFVISLPRDQPDLGGDLLKLGAYLQSFIVQSSHSITSMCIGWIDEHQLTLTIDLPELASPCSDSDGFPITLRFDFVHPNHVEEANGFLKLLPLARLQRLSLVDEANFNGSLRYWKEVFLLAREVKTLQIINVSTACRALELLAQPIIDRDHETPSTTLESRERACYLLSQLEEVEFGDVDAPFENYAPISEFESLLKALELFVHARAAKVTRAWKDSDNTISRIDIDDAEIAFTEGHRRPKKLTFFLSNDSNLDIEGADFHGIRELVEFSLIRTQ